MLPPVGLVRDSDAYDDYLSHWLKVSNGTNVVNFSIVVSVKQTRAKSTGCFTSYTIRGRRLCKCVIFNFGHCNEKMLIRADKLKPYGCVHIYARMLNDLFECSRAY